MRASGAGVVPVLCSSRWRRPWQAVLLALACLLAACAGAPNAADSAAAGAQAATDDSQARNRARTRLALAAGYYENRQFAVALDEQRKAVQADPGFADAHNLGGLIHMALGQSRLAQRDFERAIALDAQDADAWHNLGWLQCQLAQYEHASASFQRAAAMPGYQERARTLMAQGICEARAGDAAGAEATLMRAYALDPGHPLTGYNLAQLLHRRSDDARARFYIRRLNNSELANAESLWLGIRIERRLGNHQAMTQLASQLSRRFPQSRELLVYEQGAFDE